MNTGPERKRLGFQHMPEVPALALRACGGDAPDRETVIMRYIATVADPNAARTFVDYLTTLHIETQVTTSPDGVEVWVCDEDKVEQARKEFAEFTRNPTDPRYDQVAREASALRGEKALAEARFRRQQERFRRQIRPTDASSRPITMLLIAGCILVAVLTGLGEKERFLQPLLIAPTSYDPVRDVLYNPQTVTQGLRQGEVWRLVTPMFIHFGVMHILFNMLMLYQLGSVIESLMGSVRYTILVLVLSIASNLAQYYANPVLHDGHLYFINDPAFGGMSGVLYGLFGYALSRSLIGRDPRLALNPQSIFLLLGWFVLCWLDVIGHVANSAHTGGLVAGFLIGLLPELKRWWPRN
jgi:GlpG protein